MSSPSIPAVSSFGSSCDDAADIVESTPPKETMSEMECSDESSEESSSSAFMFELQFIEWSNDRQKYLGSVFTTLFKLGGGMSRPATPKEKCFAMTNKMKKE
jgi:hypothetical protein